MANYLQLHKFHSKQSVRIISSFKTFDLFVLFPIIEFERNGKLVITNNEGTEENRQETEIVVFSCHACLLEAMIQMYSEATFGLCFQFAYQILNQSHCRLQTCDPGNCTFGWIY